MTGSGGFSGREGAPQELLYAFIAFYSSLAIVFIPLTFSLVTSLKELYRTTLADALLRPWVAALSAFQERFFQYNNAFSELVVVTALWGVWVAGLTAQAAWSISCLK